MFSLLLKDLISDFILEFLLIANNLLVIAKMFFRILKLKAFTLYFYDIKAFDSEIKAFDLYFYDISSKLDPVKWWAEIQSFLR